MCDCPLCRPRTPINPLQWNENVKAYEYQRFPGYEIMCCGHPAACFDGVCGWCADTERHKDFLDKAQLVGDFFRTDCYGLRAKVSEEEFKVISQFMAALPHNPDNGVADG